ncbi:MAG: MerR family transcriptional regulator [Bacteroidales bacterium]|nr:MerR family transcriptional regulator [Bacteroidales bacterium]
MIKYSIKDLEKLTGIKAHTIRIWEKRYHLVDPSRTATNIRYYSDEDLKRLLNVSVLNRYGFRISNIVSMTSEELNSKLLDLSEQDPMFSHEVESLVLSMIEMDEQRFDKILSSSIIKFGFETTITDVLHKFLEKIGVLWQTGTITPAQEHFVSNLIRQKLILAIDGQHVALHSNAKTFLLFLPDQEYHEMGLLFFHYLIRKHGHQVIYLGQNVPVADLPEIAAIRYFDILFTSITCSLPGSGLQELLDKLGSMFSNKTILLGGYQFLSNEFELKSNMTLLHNVEELENYLKLL